MSNDAASKPWPPLALEALRLLRGAANLLPDGRLAREIDRFLAQPAIRWRPTGNERLETEK